MAAKRTGRNSRRSARSRRTRRRPARPKTAARAGMVVELAVRVRGVAEPDQRRVRLAGTVRSSGKSRSACGLRQQQAAARRLVAGNRPAELARLLAAIAHPQRIAVLKLLLAGEAIHKALAKATSLKAGPLYYHIRELRAAGLIGPKIRDLYRLTRRGRRVILAVLALERIAR